MPDGTRALHAAVGLAEVLPRRRRPEGAVGRRAAARAVPAVRHHADRRAARAGGRAGRGARRPAHGDRARHPHRGSRRPRPDPRPPGRGRGIPGRARPQRARCLRTVDGGRRIHLAPTSDHVPSGPAVMRRRSTVARSSAGPSVALGGSALKESSPTQRTTSSSPSSESSARKPTCTRASSSSCGKPGCCTSSRSGHRPACCRPTKARTRRCSWRAAVPRRATSMPPSQPGARPRGGGRRPAVGHSGRGEHPGHHRVGVPHLAGVELVAAPDGPRNGRQRVEHPAGGGRIIADPNRARRRPRPDRGSTRRSAPRSGTVAAARGGGCRRRPSRPRRGSRGRVRRRCDLDRVASPSTVSAAW